MYRKVYIVNSTIQNRSGLRYSRVAAVRIDRHSIPLRRQGNRSSSSEITYNLHCKLLLILYLHMVGQLEWVLAYRQRELRTPRRPKVSPVDSGYRRLQSVDTEPVPENTFILSQNQSSLYLSFIKTLSINFSGVICSISSERTASIIAGLNPLTNTAPD